MTDAATAVVDPQSTTEVIEQQSVVHPEEMTDKQRERWLLTGEHPEVKPNKAAPAPAKTPAKDAASQPASTTEEKPKSKTAADRKLELSAEIKDLLEKRGVLRDEEFWQKFDEFRKTPVREVKTESQPVVAKPLVEPPEPERPKRPKLIEYSTTAEYEAAMDKYDDAMLDYPAKKASYDKAKADAAENQQKMESTLRAGWKRVNERYPDATEKSKAVFQALVENQNLMPQVTWFLNSTEILPDMLYALGGQFKLDEFLELGKNNPAKAIRVLATMEKDILDELEKKPAKDDDEVIPREPKKVSQAPPPPREVGGQASVPADPIKSAVARRDFDSFAQEANRRDIQRKKRG